MLSRLAVALLLVGSLHGCLTYEYEHEFWLRVDGSGTVNVTGRPALWTAFKGLGSSEGPDGTATRRAARELFERSGLRVKRVTLTRRRGQPYLFGSDGACYTLASRTRCGIPEVADLSEYEPGPTSGHEADIVIVNGRFFRYPEGTFVE